MKRSNTSFSTGEVSELAIERQELEQVAKGLKELTNAEITRYGGLDKRVGTLYIKEAKQSNEVKLKEFTYSAETKFLLEFGENYVRFISNDLQVLAPDNSILEVSTPYLSGEVHELQFQRIQDFLYIVHPNHEPKILKRYEDNDWRLEDSNFDGPYETGSGTITVSGSSGTVDATLSEDYFQSNHVGVNLRIFYQQPADTVLFQFSDIGALPDEFDPNLPYAKGSKLRYNSTFYEYYTCIKAFSPTDSTGSNNPADYPEFFETGVEVVSPRRVTGTWEMVTTGNWRGSWEVRASADGINYVTVTTLFSDNTTNPIARVNFSGLYWLKVMAISSDQLYNSDHRVSLSIPSVTIPVEASIDSVTDSKNATITLQDSLNSGGVFETWQIDAWNNVNGYPRAVGFSDNRLLFGGTNRQPLTVWYSGINDYNNFITGTLASSPISVTAIGQDASPIMWIATLKEVFVGTSSNEGSLIPRNTDLAAGADNLPRVRWFSNEGNSYIQPVFLNGLLFAVQAGGRQLNQFQYDFSSDGYEPSEATLLHESILKSGVKQMAIRRQPEKTIFLTLNNGTSVALLHDKNSQITGWYRIETDGEILSCECIRGDGEEDDVFFAVRRGDACYIERYATGQRDLRKEGNMNDCVYLDNASYVVSEVGGDVISPLNRFEGREVSFIADGVKGTATVAGGALKLDNPATKVVVGLPYEMTVKPVNVEAFGEFGNTRTNSKDIDVIYISQWLSTGGKVRVDDGKWQDVEDLRKVSLSAASYGTQTLFTDQVEVFVNGNSKRTKEIEFKHDEPFPFTILGIYSKFSNNEL